MVEINVKLEENSTVSQFTHTIGKALEEFLLKTNSDVLNRVQMLEAQIINYYKLHGNDNFKDYFGIIVEEPKEKNINEGEDIKEEAKVVELNPTKNANKTKKAK